jgi:uncharacterized protein YqhQ
MAADSTRRSTYGGQAVIEGVMMRGPAAYSIAVRAPDQSIVVESWSLGRLASSRVKRIPFLRGLLVLWEALSLGVRSLAFSANAQALKESERIEGASLTLSLAGSLLVGTAGFLLLPAGAAHLLQGLFGLSSFTANIVEGGLRLSLLIGYIASIGRVPEIRRVFGYHAAEHMTIHAFEAGDELSAAQVARHPKEHPRCGTAFLLTVALLSVVLFTLLGPMTLGARLVTRVVAIPLLASIGYEYVRLTARLSETWLGRILIWPNLALQHLTTRPPDPEMLEVAIRSFEALLERERELGSSLADPGTPP